MLGPTVRTREHCLWDETSQFPLDTRSMLLIISSFVSLYDVKWCFTAICDNYFNLFAQEKKTLTVFKVWINHIVC